MAINRKLLVSVGAIVVALFVISNPLGDAHHGLGRHNALLADLGQGLFVASLVGAVVFIALVMLGLFQLTRRSRRAHS